jgi:hypothetical protein
MRFFFQFLFLEGAQEQELEEKRDSQGAHVPTRRSLLRGSAAADQPSGTFPALAQDTGEQHRRRIYSDGDLVAQLPAR